MGDNICVLVTLSDGNTLLDCAIKVNTSQFVADDIVEHPMEHREGIYFLLPDHVKSFGNIVDVRNIFDVRDLTK